MNVTKKKKKTDVFSCLNSCQIWVLTYFISSTLNLDVVENRNESKTPRGK